MTEPVYYMSDDDMADCVDVVRRRGICCDGDSGGRISSTRYAPDTQNPSVNETISQIIKHIYVNILGEHTHTESEKCRGVGWPARARTKDNRQSFHFIR